MDYIERRAKRLEADYRHCLRDYKRALSRTWILRERLGRLPLAALDGAGGISSLSSDLSAVAERAGWLRRRTSEAQGRLKVFDPDEQRRWNKDVDGHCRMLMLDGTRCGKPTVEDSRWCAGHVDMWDDCDPWGNHIIGMWREIRFAYTATGMLVRLTAPTPVGLDTLRETIARSRGKLERETYGFDRKCTRKDVERWLTVPAEYTRGGVVSLASCPFCGGTVHLVFDRDFRRGIRYGLAHEQPCPLLPTLWAAYGVNADTLVRCWSQRYGVANRLRALGEDDLADRLA